MRTAGGDPTRLNHIYHSGETEDGAQFLRWPAGVRRRSTYAVGYSLGERTLACALAKKAAIFPIGRR